MIVLIMAIWQMLLTNIYNQNIKKDEFTFFIEYDFYGRLYFI